MSWQTLLINRRDKVRAELNAWQLNPPKNRDNKPLIDELAAINLALNEWTCIGGGGGSNMQILDEGISQGVATTLNFVGIGIEATVSGSDATVRLLSNTGISNATTSTTDPNQTILSLPISTYRSAWIYISITNGTNYHNTQINLLHNNTNVFLQQIGELYTDSILATFDASIETSNMILTTTPLYNNTDFKIAFTAITV